MSDQKPVVTMNDVLARLRDLQNLEQLFGATAESVIKEQLERFIRAEQVIGNAWLASHQ